MKNKIKFIHSADFHLDSPFKGMNTLPAHISEEMRESTFSALDKLVEQAIEHQVDFVLITGDVFDHLKPSLKAVMRFQKAMTRLKEKQIQAFVSYGNHDYNQAKQKVVRLPDNVHIFTGEQVTRKVFWKNGAQAAHIYGFSYTKRAITERKVLEYKKEEGEGYHIAMLHGSVVSNTEHDVYAPFQVSELVEKPFDYWALGHIHKREILQQVPVVAYSGNIQGRSRKETGEKGCFLIEMTDRETEVTFLPLQQVRFESVQLEVSEIEEWTGLETRLENELMRIQEAIGSAIVDVTLKSNKSILKNWQRNGYIEEMIEVVNESLSEKEDWIWLRQIKIDELPDWDISELKKEDHFIGELVRNFENGDEKQFLNPLFNHKRARKYLEPLTREEIDELTTEARDELLSLLTRE